MHYCTTTQDIDISLAIITREPSQCVACYNVICQRKFPKDIQRVVIEYHPQREYFPGDISYITLGQITMFSRCNKAVMVP